MKRLFITVFALAVGVGSGWFVGIAVESRRSASALAEKEAQWQHDKAALEAALADAKAQQQAVSSHPQREVVEVIKKQTPEEIIDNLKTLTVRAGDTKNVREAILQFENLIACGKDALPAIRAFLASNGEIAYDRSIFGSWKISKDGSVPTDFVFPPSLRFGLFDSVKKIGGPDAEQILAEALHVTGRGVEVAYLTRVLEQMAPLKYREAAIGVAKDLLSHPLPGNPGDAFDKNDKNYLFGVLAFYRDPSLAASAQAQLVQSDGKIDQGALHYLQQTLGNQAVPIVAQAYQNGTFADPDQKEPLARVALNFAGSDPRADALWSSAIFDQSINPDKRRELIEDLNQDGFENLKNLTDRDVELIQRRLALIDKFGNQAETPIIQNAFGEAQKDLQDMLAKALKARGH